MPELYTFDVKNYMGSVFNDSPNFGVHPYMLHIGNNLLEENLNTSKVEVTLQEELDENKRVEDEKKVTKNKNIPLIMIDIGNAVKKITTIPQ